MEVTVQVIKDWK